MAEMTAPNVPLNPASSEKFAKMLAVARDLFFTQGYDRTSVKDIADRLGILKGSLYHYIGSKDDLLFALMHDAYVRARARTDDAVAAATDPIAKIYGFVHAYATFCAEELEAMAIFNREFSNLDGERGEQIRTERRAYEEALRGMINAAKSDGLLPEASPTSIAVRAIFGMCNTIPTWYRPRDDGMQPDDVGHVYGQLAIASLRNPGLDM